MAEFKAFDEIAGVQLVRLVPHSDDRGTFVETFRKEWFPQREWGKVQMNLSYSKRGCVRGLHYHHRQVDYWTFIQGEFRVGLYDLRPSSSTYGRAATIDVRAEDRMGIYIPVGVAHGFATKTDVVMTYLVDNYYDPDASDENEVAWNDPDIGIDWGIEVTRQSERDRKARRLKDIPEDELPK